MKKIIITVAVALIATISISAKPTGLNIGGGIGYSGWVPYDQVDYLTAYVEVGYDLRVARQSYVYFGGRYQEGFNNKGCWGMNWTIGDLFIPVRFQQNFLLGAKSSTFYIEAGPALGVFLYCEGKGRSSNYRMARHYERVNVYVGGNIGFKIHKHCKIYLGGDYGCIPTADGVEAASRWQINLGACYVF